MKTFKKLFLSLSLLLITSIVNAQSKQVDNIIDKTSDAVEKVYSDGTKVVTKAYDASTIIAPKIESALKSIGSELKVATNEVWDILVKQQLVWSICILILGLITIGSWFHFWYRYSKCNEGYKRSDNEGGNLVFSVIITCAIAIAGTIITSMHFTNMITGFLNPKFGAMNTIATIASQIK